MVTKQVDIRQMPWELVPMDFRRSGLIFSWFAYSRIVVHKHTIAPPEPDFEALSNEEIELQVSLLKDLAHLPPS